MIYISPAIVVAGTPEDLNRGWIGYRNVLTRDNTTATDSAVGYPVANLVNNTTNQQWKAADASGTKYITISGQGAAEADYFGLARHNLGSTGATITLQNSPDASTWTDASEEITPGTDYALMYRFEADTAAYWRLRIVPGSAAPAIAVMHLGKLLILERRIYVGHTPITLGRWASVTSGGSENNNFLGRVIKARGLKSGVDLKNLTPQWLRDELDPFFEAAQENTAFFWAWRPSSYPTEVGYAWMEGDANVVNEKPNGMMTASWSMKGIR